jgi:F-type H+-transporting ATPase subunit delta
VVLAPNSTVDPDRVLKDLRGFEQALAASSELAVALASPSISRPRKRAVVSRLAETLGITGIARNFLLVLIDHRRTTALSEILDAFERMLDERRGILKADVTSASPLEQRHQDALVQRLELMTGKKIGLILKVNGDLVGGLVVRMGSTVYDGSVRGQLEALGRQLLAD